MKKLTSYLLVALLPMVSACADLNVGDLNNPDLNELRDNPTPTLVRTAATGLLIGNRNEFAEANGYVSLLGILGRESYNFDAADPRFITEMLVAEQLDPGSPRFGGNFWADPYRNVQNAHVLLQALDKVVGMDDADRNGVRGFARTIQALDLLIVANTRYDNGVVVDVSGGVDNLGPLVTHADALTHIAGLLDQAVTDLEAAGDDFSFPLSNGYAGFDTPASFLLFNRGLRARVAAYAGDAAGILSALGNSFMVVDTGSPQMSLGVYHSFSTGPGDTLNGLVDPNIFVHPLVSDEAEGGDARVAARIIAKSERTVQGLTSDEGFAQYQSITAPVPILRNEELILLRAEAHILNGDVGLAADDINHIRVYSGGLPVRNDLDANNIEDELLTQRRYSLLMEGHRWVDMRRFGRLAELPLDDPSHHVHEAFPVPVEETDAR
jgi:hypothetical protein